MIKTHSQWPVIWPLWSKCVCLQINLKIWHLFQAIGFLTFEHPQSLIQAQHVCDMIKTQSMASGFLD